MEQDSPHFHLQRPACPSLGHVTCASLIPLPALLSSACLLGCSFLNWLACSTILSPGFPSVDSIEGYGFDVQVPPSLPALPRKVCVGALKHQRKGRGPVQCEEASAGPQVAGGAPGRLWSLCPSPCSPTLLCLGPLAFLLVTHL